MGLIDAIGAVNIFPSKPKLGDPLDEVVAEAWLEEA
jgi:hypothetical protein